MTNGNRTSPRPAEPEAYPASFEVEDGHAANELFQHNGWTDGLPIVPPTPDLVAAFLEQVGLQPEDIVGVEPVRQRRIAAGKVAANAVMAGCLPAYMPIVVAIIEAMCRAGVRPARQLGQHRRQCAFHRRQRGGPRRARTERDP